VSRPSSRICCMWPPVPETRPQKTRQPFWTTNVPKKRLFCRDCVKPSNELEPMNPSSPWRFWVVTRVHARSLTTRFLLEIRCIQRLRMRRETSRVSFLMCPFCVRALVPETTTSYTLSRALRRDAIAVDPFRADARELVRAILVGDEWSRSDAIAALTVRELSLRGTDFKPSPCSR
jgi:hypothetical protein